MEEEALPHLVSWYVAGLQGLEHGGSCARLRRGLGPWLLSTLVGLVLRLGFCNGLSRRAAARHFSAAAPVELVKRQELYVLLLDSSV